MLVALQRQHYFLLLQYEMLHVFTLATLNAMCQELERADVDPGVNQDPVEIFKALDDTHQHYRSKLLKAIRKIR